MSDKPIIFNVVKGVEGYSLYLNDTRICGPKPWGGGPIIHTFTVSEFMCDVDVFKEKVKEIIE